jgi:hypothetical protein
VARAFVRILLQGAGEYQREPETTEKLAAAVIASLNNDRNAHHALIDPNATDEQIDQHDALIELAKQLNREAAMNGDQEFAPNVFNVDDVLEKHVARCASGTSTNEQFTAQGRKQASYADHSAHGLSNCDGRSRGVGATTASERPRRGVNLRPL